MAENDPNLKLKLMLSEMGWARILKLGINIPHIIGNKRVKFQNSTFYGTVWSQKCPDFPYFGILLP